MTTANKITIVRILFIPVFVAELLYYFKTGGESHRLAALLSFVVASVLDGVDGYIARRYNQRSELGAILDPLADKLLLVSAVVLLSLPGPHFMPVIPSWLTVVILSRDVLLVLGLVVIYYTCGKSNVRPRVSGKIATVLQMITVVWILLKWNERWLAIWETGAGIFTAYSGLFYLLDWMRQMSASPTSSPTPKQ